MNLETRVFPTWPPRFMSASTCLLLLLSTTHFQHRACFSWPWLTSTHCMTTPTASPVPASTPVHLHPLSTEEPPPKSRRTRTSGQRQGDAPASPESATNTRSPNYFALKAQLEAGTRDGRGNWDGSVRGYGKASSRSAAHEPMLADFSAGEAERGEGRPALQDRRRQAPPLFVVGSSRDAYADSELNLGEVDNHDLSPEATAQILATRWHDYSDEAIQSSISGFSISSSPAYASAHPYHTALRVLSSAYQNLTRVRRRLEEERKLLREKEDARRQRADELMKELQPSEQDVARRVLQSLFTDDDEGEHRIQRKQSHMVSRTLPPRTHEADAPPSLSPKPFRRPSWTRSRSCVQETPTKRSHP